MFLGLYNNYPDNPFMFRHPVSGTTLTLFSRQKEYFKQTRILMDDLSFFHSQFVPHFFQKYGNIKALF